MNLLQIGYGKAGKHMARLFYERGYDVTIALRSLDESIRCSSEDYNFIKLSEVRGSYDLTLIATNDASISEASEFVSKRVKTDFAVHLSGASSIDKLSSFTVKSPKTKCMSIHPNIAFSNDLKSSDWWQGVYFGITFNEVDSFHYVKKYLIYDEDYLIVVPDSEKPRYHAAAVLASNLIMPVINASVNIYTAMGISEESARKIASSLAVSSALNLNSTPFKDAITGPIARGDYETVKRHLSNLNGDEKIVYQATSEWLSKLV